MKMVEIIVSHEDFKKITLELSSIFCLLEKDDGEKVPALQLNIDTFLILIVGGYRL